MKKIYVIFFYFLHLINVQAGNTDELSTQELIKKGEQAWINNDFATARQMFFEAAQAGDYQSCYNYALCFMLERWHRWRKKRS